MVLALAIELTVVLAIGVRDATQESSRQAANARACHEDEKTGEHSHESSLTYRFAALLLIGKRFPNYWSILASPPSVLPNTSPHESDAGTWHELSRGTLLLT
jgi:hypothetical protein